MTVTEIIVIIIMLLVIILLLLPALGGRGDMRQLKDATKLRGIGQGMVLWAFSNDGKYPLPSMIDIDNTTVGELGRAKDTTANIMSLLVGEGYITEELLISPLEFNPNVTVYKDYQFQDITAAVDPEQALWDPGMSADFTSLAGGNISYAHLIPVGDRLDMWTKTDKASEAVLSNRGPEIAATHRRDGNVTTWFAEKESQTLGVFNGQVDEDAWSGNVAYNDNHVDFQANWYAHDKYTQTGEYFPRLKFPEGEEPDTSYHDVLFHDEEGFPTNHFLGIFSRAGETKEDYRAIWD